MMFLVCTSHPWFAGRRLGTVVLVCIASIGTPLDLPFSTTACIVRVKLPLLAAQQFAVIGLHGTGYKRLQLRQMHLLDTRCGNGAICTHIRPTRVVLAGVSIFRAQTSVGDGASTKAT